MRIGKRMREILNILEKADRRLTLTEIIMKIKNLEYYHYREEGVFTIGKKRVLVTEKIRMDHHQFICMKLASALAKRYISYWDNDTKADLLYATYKRSIKILWQTGLIKRIKYLNNNKTQRITYYIEKN